MKKAVATSDLTTHLTVAKSKYGPRKDRIATITDEKVDCKGGIRISIEHNHHTGAVTIHYRGDTIYVSGTCPGDLVCTGNVELYNITVVGSIERNL